MATTLTPSLRRVNTAERREKAGSRRLKRQPAAIRLLLSERTERLTQPQRALTRSVQLPGADAARARAGRRLGRRATHGRRHRRAPRDADLDRVQARLDAR